MPEKKGTPISVDLVRDLVRDLIRDLIRESVYPHENGPFLCCLKMTKAKGGFVYSTGSYTN